MNKQQREKRSRKLRAQAKLKEQHKRQAIRAKYGPEGKPSPVIVKKLETDEVVSVVDQDRFKKKVYAESLEIKAKAAGYASYTAYLRSPAWLALREEVLKRDRYRCRRCRSRSFLSVHHRHYEHLGNERLRDLETLCRSCHRTTH